MSRVARRGGRSIEISRALLAFVANVLLITGRKIRSVMGAKIVVIGRV